MPANFKISEAGATTDFDAVDAAVTWNATDNEYLVVWRSSA